MIRPSIVALALTGAASAALIQKPFLQVPAKYKNNANVVKQIFNQSYTDYTKYAYGHDDVSPVSESFNDPRNGWGASIADAMSTMLIMGGFESEFEAAVKHFQGINFNQSYTSDTVSLFETTIRYVGGFLSAYELSNYKYPILVTKAKQIADKLVHGFDDGAVGVPYGFVDFSTNQPTLSTSNVAEAGTLTLEWTRLSQYTNNQTYARLSQNSAKHIAKLPAPYPGLPGQGIDPSTGNFTDSYVTWGGGTDSYLEYLIKFARLTNTLDNTYAGTWKTAVDSSIKNLQSHPTVGNWTYLADSPSPGQITPTGSNLECFHAGNWIMGGQMLNNKTIVDFALKLADSCWNTYASTETGIGPEVFRWETSDPTTVPPSDNLAFYNQHGYYIPDGYDYYDLRPEVLESNFYAWRLTGDTKYLDRAQSAIQSFQKYLVVNGGYAGIQGIDDIANIEYFDNTESFWFAEVLKYLYLTFDDPSHISLDEWVFNTECHPLKAPLPLPTYQLPGPFNAPVAPTSPSHGPVSKITQHAVISPIPGLPAGLKQIAELYPSAS